MYSKLQIRAWRRPAAGPAGHVKNAQPSRLLPSFHLAPEVLLLDGLALVILLLTTRKSDIQLGVTVLCHEKTDSNDSEALLLDLLLEMNQFTLLEKQLAVTQRRMLAPGAPRLKSDIDATDIQLPLLEKAERVRHRRPPGTDRLDFRSDKHNTGRISLQELVIERGPLVIDIHSALLLFRHSIKLWTQI